MRRLFRVLVGLGFVSALAAVLYFSLVPNVRGDLYRIFPWTAAFWFGMHDDLANLAAFAVLGAAGYWASRGLTGAIGGKRRGLAGAIRSHRALVLAGMLFLVCALEVAQIWIPGRYSSLWDVVVGWGGVLAAWLLCAGCDRLVAKFRRK